jgi:hypothetical protein
VIVAVSPHVSSNAKPATVSIRLTRNKQGIGAADQDAPHLLILIGFFRTRPSSGVAFLFGSFKKGLLFISRGAFFFARDFL